MGTTPGAQRTAVRPRRRQKNAFLRGSDIGLRRSWRQRRGLLAAVFFVGFTLLILLTAVFGQQGVLRVRALNGEKEDLGARIAALKDETRVLRRRVREMQAEPFPYEKAARERLGMVRPGEIVYDFRRSPLEEAD